MKIMTWNVRGLNNWGKRRVVKEVIKSLNPMYYYYTRQRLQKQVGHLWVVLVVVDTETGF